MGAGGALARRGRGVGGRAGGAQEGRRRGAGGAWGRALERAGVEGEGTALGGRALERGRARVCSFVRQPRSTRIRRMAARYPPPAQRSALTRLPTCMNSSTNP